MGDLVVGRRRASVDVAAHGGARRTTKEGVRGARREAIRELVRRRKERNGVQIRRQARAEQR